MARRFLAAPRLPRIAWELGVLVLLVLAVFATEIVPLAAGPAGEFYAVPYTLDRPFIWSGLRSCTNGSDIKLDTIPDIYANDGFNCTGTNNLIYARQDVCDSSTVLTEYWVGASATSTFAFTRVPYSFRMAYVTCQYGCRDGACVRPTTIPSGLIVRKCDTVTTEDYRDNLNIVFTLTGYQTYFPELISKLPEYVNNFLQVEPFKSNQDKIRFWWAHSGTLDFYNCALLPYRKEIVLNVNPAFTQIGGHSSIIGWGKITTGSVAEIWIPSSVLSGAGRERHTDADYNGTDLVSYVILHEFGHEWGGLSDEYVAPALGWKPRIPNCAATIEQARAWWGNISGAGYYHGCSYYQTNVKPTSCSIMSGPCQFDYSGAVAYMPSENWTHIFGPVNEKWMAAILSTYTNQPVTRFSESPELLTKYSPANRQALVANKTYALSLGYVNNTIKLRNITIFSTLPFVEAKNQSGEYKANLLDEDSNLIYSMRFDFPLEIGWFPPTEWFDKQGNQIYIPPSDVREKTELPAAPEPSVMLMLPFFSNADTIVILNSLDVEVLRIDVSQIG